MTLHYLRVLKFCGIFFTKRVTYLISRIKRWQVFRSFFQVETPFELKLNVTDTELVVVENAAMWDTNAIILKVMLIPVGFHH